MYSACVVETVTGKYLGPLDAKVEGWSRELNGTDTATVTMSPGALTVTTRDWLRLITTPWRMTLVIQWEGIPFFAGPIISRPFDGKQVTINAAGVRTAIFGRRKAHTWTTPYASQVISYTGMSLGSTAQALALVGTSASKAGASIPIVYPATEVSSDTTLNRSYNGFELKDISSLWAELTASFNGPDIDFVPGWTDSTSTKLQYTMRIGTIAQPKLQSVGALSFNYSQPASSVKSMTFIEDAALQTTTQWAAGSGTDVGTTMSMTTNAALTSAGWPLLEKQTDYRTVSTQTILDAKTVADLATYATSTFQFGLTVDITQPPAFGTYLPGDLATVTVRNSIWIPDNDYNMRIIKMSGDSSTTITLDVQAA